MSIKATTYSNMFSVPLSLDTMRAAVERLKKTSGQPIEPILQIVSPDMYREAKDALDRAKRGKIVTLSSGHRLIIVDRGRRERRRQARRGLRGRRGAVRVADCAEWVLIDPVPPPRFRYYEATPTHDRADL